MNTGAFGTFRDPPDALRAELRVESGQGPHGQEGPPKTGKNNQFSPRSLPPQVTKQPPSR